MSLLFLFPSQRETQHACRMPKELSPKLRFLPAELVHLGGNRLHLGIGGGELSFGLLSSDARFGGSGRKWWEGRSGWRGETSEFGGRIAEAGFKSEGTGDDGYPRSEKSVLLCIEKKEVNDTRLGGPTGSITAANGPS